MMRYVVINPCGGYTYKGNGFLVLLGYGGGTNPTSVLDSQTYLVIEDPSGNNLHVCCWQVVWADGSSLTGNANLNSGLYFNRGIMVNGSKIHSNATNGTDIATAIECDTLEEAATLL